MTSPFLIESVFNTDRLLASLSLSLWTLFSRRSSFRQCIDVVCTVLKHNGTAGCNILHRPLLFFV